jgi:hypothetical protein
MMIQVSGGRHEEDFGKMCNFIEACLVVFLVVGFLGTILGQIIGNQMVCRVALLGCFIAVMAAVVFFGL